MIYWYKKVLNQYADFEGRARRTEYWMFTLVNILIMIPLYVIGFIGITSQSSLLSSVGFGLYMLYALATLVPSIAVGVRRLHDTGKSGWMLLIGLIPIIGSIWLLVLFVTEGDKGDNQYGLDPKA
jgi:uncharacterized membrane protein YhaH (DUF805 family)